MKLAAFYENIKTGAEASGVSVEAALAQLKEAGLENLYARSETIRTDMEWLLPLLDKYELGFEGLYEFCDFAHNTDDETGRKCIELAAQVHAGNVLLLPGVFFPGEQDRKDELNENMRKGLEQAVVFAEGTGVKVTLEDFDGMIAPYNCISGMKWFMDNTEGLLCSFDTGNFVMYQEDPLEAFEALKDFIVTVHVKDRSRSPIHPGDAKKECADGTIVYPCPVGRGYIPLEEITRRLKDRGYDGGLIAELYDCDPEFMLEEIGNSLRYLKKLSS